MLVQWWFKDFLGYIQQKDNYKKDWMANATTWCVISMNFPKIQNLTIGKVDSCE